MIDDVDQREAAIRRMLPLVRTIARRVQRMVPSADLDDLIGDGCVGLMRAIDAFDPSRGPTLEQYASKVIAGTVLNGVRRMDPVSERARREVRHAESERCRIAIERGELPSNAEMEQRRPAFARARLVAHRGSALSLDSPLPEGERISPSFEDDPARIVAESTEREAVTQALQCLPERRRMLLELHYRDGLSMRDIGKRLSISAQRASQLHLAALASLRKHVVAAPR